MAEAATHISRVRAAPPLVKTGLWFGGVAAAALLIQAGAALLGFEFHIFAASGAGRGVVVVLAMIGLAALISAERRPLGDYGLVVEDRWRRRSGAALLAGLASLGGMYLLAAAMGGLTLGSAPETERVVKSILKAIPAMPIAMVLTIIFPGYLLSMFRERHGRVFSCVVVGALFAAMTRFEDAGAFLEAESIRTLIGMGLAGVLLCQLRMRTGSVVVPGGLLVGWVAVRRLAKGTRIFEDGADAQMAALLAPAGEPRQAPLVWLGLGIAIFSCAMALRRQARDAVIPQQEGMSESFRKFYPLANMGMFAPADVWLTQLWRARFRVGRPYIVRAVVIVASSIMTFVTTLPERLLAPIFLRRRPLDPVFIVGVHRSGTTHLQNLLALDPQFACARTFQVINPFGFLVTGWLLVPILKGFSPWTRPMDSVAFGVFSPNEEEYAIANASGLSPDWAVRLPREIDRYERFTYPDRWTSRERARWKRVMDRFVRKLVVFRRRRRPLLKNPYNTARVALLRELYPGARFVHIHRDPHRVYLSNMRMARLGHTLFQMQDPIEGNDYQSRFLDNYAQMERAYYRDADALPEGASVEVRYEDLDADAIGEVRRIYAALGLAYSEDYDARLRAYLGAVAGYRKNTFKPLEESVRALVNDTLADLFPRWGREPAPAAGREGDAAQAHDAQERREAPQRQPARS